WGAARPARWNQPWESSSYARQAAGCAPLAKKCIALLRYAIPSLRCASRYPWGSIPTNRVGSRFLLAMCCNLPGRGCDRFALDDFRLQAHASRCGSAFQGVDHLAWQFRVGLAGRTYMRVVRFLCAQAEEVYSCCALKRQPEIDNRGNGCARR